MKIKIKDIISYLEKIGPECEVELDRDGWGEEEFKRAGIEIKTPEDLIIRSGLFCTFACEGEKYLIINN